MNIDLKTEGELYLENLKLLAKVNPIAVEVEKKRIALDHKVLEKKRNDKLLSQKNLGF